MSNDNEGMVPSATAGEVARYAGFWRRAGASLIDSVAIWAVLFVVAFAMGWAGATDDAVEKASLGASWLGTWLYYALMHSSPWQATLGKHAIGIKVTDLSGERIGFGRATGRHFATLLSALTLFVGFAMAGFTRQRQALHDLVARTLVVSNGTTRAIVEAGQVQAPQVSAGVVVLAVLAGLVPVTGIVAAIAIPAYQDYTIRSQLTNGLSSAATAKVAVEAAYASGRAFEDMQSDTLEIPNVVSPYVSSISVNGGVLVVEYGGTASEHLAGTQLLLVPGSTPTGTVVWICGLAPVPNGVTPAIDGHERYTNVAAKYLPLKCRGE